MRFRLGAVVGVVACVLAAPATVVGAAEREQSSGEGQSTAPGGLVWVRSDPTINPGGDQPPPDSTVTATDGHLTVKVLVPPEAQFDATFTKPPTTLAAGATRTLAVTVSGKLTGRKDVQRYWHLDAILLVNDRWDGSAVGVEQSCTVPIGSGPTTCTPDATSKGTFKFAAPAPAKAGDTFSIGIGALNCSACYIRYEYVAKGSTSQSKAATTTKAAPGASGTLALDYQMPARYGLPGKNGIQAQQSIEEFDPDEWHVEVTAERKDGEDCSPDDTLAVTAPKALRWRRTGPCSFRVDYKREGTYTVSATLKTAAGKRLSGTRNIVAQDWLLVGIGDSNGSGEGAPDLQRHGTTPERWQNRQCHRSANSYQAQTARAIERRDPRTSVTFVHLACSGATITKGLLGPYKGIEPGRSLPAQVPQMRFLVGKREIDAVLLSIGVNDLGFGPLVVHCIFNQGCASTPFPDKTSPKTLAQVVADKFAELPGLYDQLAQALHKAGVADDRVYITEYFDSTRDEKGSFCNPLIYTPLGSFSRAEAKWAHDQFLVPLNAAVAQAAHDHGWHVVTGAAAGFRTHGYCSNDSWIVHLLGTFASQSNKEGTLHSTARGDTFQAGLVVPKLRSSLYPGGAPRPPVG